MATVYLARDLKHERPVALKVLHPDLAAGFAAERFLREIRIAANLQHPTSSRSTTRARQILGKIKARADTESVGRA